MGVFPENNPKFDAIYAEESAMVESAEAIALALEKSGVSRSQLADRLGVSKAEVTHRLQGERNITVRKLAATLHALGFDLEVGIRDRKPELKRSPSRWQPRDADNVHQMETEVRSGYRVARPREEQTCQ